MAGDEAMFSRAPFDRVAADADGDSGSADGTFGGAELGGRVGLGSTSASAEVERERASPC